MNEKTMDKVKGCMFGGAVGDALGYPVEFKYESEIKNKYPNGRIESYDLSPEDGLAYISDDTQMSLFTASGLLVQQTRHCMRGIAASPCKYVRKSYQDWYKTQTMTMEKYLESDGDNYSWLMDVPELWARRAPGNTCMDALRMISEHKYEPDGIANPINNSKGCGGIMRIAPIALWYTGNDMSILDQEAAQIAAITHGHPYGYLSAAALAHILHLIVYGDPELSLEDIIRDAEKTLLSEFDEYWSKALNRKIEKTIELSENNLSDIENIHKIGKGWTGEQTLCISLYCALRHRDDFSEGVIAAVNHDGDSDSTGAVTGNILGAICGYAAIEDKWKHNLELSNVILEMAEDIASGCPMEEYGHHSDHNWERKYVDMHWKE